MKKIILMAGLILLLAFEIGRVYFIMPFPGSQKSNTIDLAYWIDQNIIWVRIVLILLIAIPAINIFRQRKIWKKILLGCTLLLYAVVFYLFNFKFLADKMFYQPRSKQFQSSQQNTIAEDKLVIAVELNGEAKAYPIQLIGYHHQVTDTIGMVPVMVTYCTVCRTGRVFSPEVNGKHETFRLVGMDHFNAMIEDASTHSWWRQATGKAITGPLKGTALKEIPSAQMTLGAWLKQYPQSLVLQPDTIFNKRYKGLAGFDRGTIKSGLEKRDSTSWKFKSWVVGISHDNVSKAYDWNDLANKRIIQDSLPGLPVLLMLDSDTASFYVYNRMVDGKALHFKKDSTQTSVTDTNTGSIWNLKGECTEGQHKGRKLQPVQSYQEFWHSWSTFHPNTLKYM